MRKFIGIITAVAAIAVLASPVFAASLGISPSLVEVEVQADSNVTADFQVHYFKGDVAVNMDDIPLRVEPEILHVDALAGPVDVQLTIFGDSSLGSQVYDGYIRFTGMSGDMVAVAIKIRARVTNIVEGQPIPVVTDVESSASQESAVVTSASGVNSGGLPLTTAIIIAGGVVFLGLVGLGIAIARRRSY